VTAPIPTERSRDPRRTAGSKEPAAQRPRRRLAAGLSVAALFLLLAAAVARSGPPSLPRAAAVLPATPVAAPADVPRRLVVLGDSVPAGSACHCPGFGTILAAQQSADLTNEAVPGLTSGGLLAQLHTPQVATALSSATIVTVTVGANDFPDTQAGDAVCADLSCYRGALARLTTTMNAVIAKIAALTRPGTEIVVTGYWNVFLDGSVAAQRGPTYVLVSNALTRAVNSALAAASHAHHDLYVDLYTPFKGNGADDDTDLLAEDGDHPNSLGQQAIATAITQCLHRCARCLG